MKLLIALLFISQCTFAAVPSANPKPSVLTFTQLTAKQFGEFRGKPLTKVETVLYNQARKQALKQQDPNEEVKNPNRFNWLGFVLGLVFPYGLIASYFFKDRSVRRSAWIGTGVALIVGVILLLSYASKG
jgi:hypothetical protein